MFLYYTFILLNDSFIEIYAQEGVFVIEVSAIFVHLKPCSILFVHVVFTSVHTTPTNLRAGVQQMTVPHLHLHPGNETDHLPKNNLIILSRQDDVCLRLNKNRQTFSLGCVKGSFDPNCAKQLLKLQP